MDLHFELDNFYYEPMEIELIGDSFLQIRETLTRIGIYSKRTNTIWQSCHILHKQGKMYIVHFKELFALSSRDVEITDGDILRRNRIAYLLAEWGLLKVVTKSQLNNMAPMSEMMVIPFKDKGKYNLRTKYTMLTERIEQEKAKHGIQ